MAGAAFGGPPAVVTQPAVLLVRGEAIDSSIRSFLPLRINGQTGATQFTVTDAVACGAGTPNSEKVLLFAANGAAAPRKLTRADCGRTLSQLGSARCGVNAAWLAAGTIEWIDPRIALRITDAVQVDRDPSTRSCRSTAVAARNWEAYSLDKSVILAALAVTEAVNVDIVAKQDSATVFVRPVGTSSPSTSSMASTHAALSMDRADALENAVLDLSVQDLSRGLEANLAAHPITFDITNAGPLFPKRGTISSASVAGGPGNSIIIAGPLVTDVAGIYDTNITLAGSDLAIEKVETVYRPEDCTGFTDIRLRLECEGRNRIRPPIANGISGLLTQITKGIHLRPVSSMYFLKVPFAAPGQQISPLIRRIERVGDRVRVHAFIASETAS